MYKVGGVIELLRGHSVHIAGINEILFKWKKFLEKEDISVTVEGECWKLLGYKEVKADLSENIIISDETCMWLDELYISYMSSGENTRNRVPHLQGKNIFYITASSEAICQYNGLLDNGIFPDEVCSLDNNYKEYLFGKKIIDKEEALKQSKNCKNYLLGRNCNIKVEEMAERLLRKNGMFDNVCVLAEYIDDKIEGEPVSLMKNIGKSILLGNKKLCLLFKEYYSDICELLYIEPDNMKECAGLHQNALWFYIDYPCAWRFQYLPVFRKCQKYSIYLSDYFLKNTQFLEHFKNSKGLVDEISYLNSFTKSIEFDREIPPKTELIFWAASYPHFWDSIDPLYRKCKEHGIKCAVAFPESKDLRTSMEIKMFQRIRRKVNELRLDGTVCVEQNNQIIFNHNYYLCYFCAGNGEEKRIPIKLRRRCKYIVGVQIIAYYTHVYMGDFKFNDLFCKKVMDKIDYLIVSQFMANWIEEKTEVAQGKLLPFGFPKMDLLYKEFKQNEQEIPIEWGEAVLNKKVYLFLTYDSIPDRDWLDYFRNNGRLIIWRPHPLALTANADYIKELKEDKMLNIIVDDRESYSASFKLSNCLIAPLYCSAVVNYMYTDKPVFIVDADKGKQIEDVNYREEPWYRASYNGTEMQLQDFIGMVENNKDILHEKKKPYREIMMQGFDGKVCERIVSFFQNNY